MLYLFQIIIFLVFSLYSLTKAIFYALYEIKEEKNKTGGLLVLSISLIAFIFTLLIIYNLYF